MPTPEETLRIKAWMIAERGATRDFLDVAALGDLLGPEGSATALDCFSDLYDPVGTESATMRFAQAAMTRPVDEADVDLNAYRGLTESYRNIDYVLQRVREIAVPALERELRLHIGTPASSPATPSAAIRSKGDTGRKRRKR